MRRLALIAALILLTASQARAAEAVPGSSCAGYTANSFQWAGGPENGGVTNGMFCNGGTNLFTGIINFQSSGNVGIGTTAPGGQLHVNIGAAATKGLIVEGASSQSADLQEWQKSSGAALMYIDSNATLQSDRSVAGSNRLDSAVINVSCGNVYGCITGNGNQVGVYGVAVGLGAVTPFLTGPYHIDSNGAGVIGVNTQTGVEGDFTNAGPGVYGHSHNGYGVYGYDDNVGVGGYFSSSAGYGLIVASGKVGIGTATPQTRLDVNGTIRFAYGGELCTSSTIGGLYYSSATQLMYGCLTAGTWTQIATGSGVGLVTAAGSGGDIQFNNAGNTLGDTVIESLTDTGDANYIISQPATLGQAGTIQSISIYTPTVAGHLRLGIYDATGPSGGPGAKKAETNGFTPTVGWNTQNVITPVALPAGNYWLAFLPDNNSLQISSHFVSTIDYYPFTYGTMPATFSTTPSTGGWSYSLYATVSGPPNVLGASSSLFWNNTNNYFGIGTASPAAPLHVNNTSGGSNEVLDARFSAPMNSGNNAAIDIYASGGNVSQTRLQYTYLDGSVSSPGTKYSYIAFDWIDDGSYSSGISLNTVGSEGGIFLNGPTSIGYNNPANNSTNAPANGLAVNGDIVVNGALHITPTASSSNGWIYLTGKSSGTAHTAWIWADFSGDLDFRPAPSNNAVTFMQDDGGTTRIYISPSTSSGYVGINTTSPAAPLHVNGEAIVGMKALACSSTTAGAVRYNSSNFHMEYCNSSTWQMVAPGTWAGNTANGTLAAGNTIYCAPTGQYCSGIAPSVTNSGVISIISRSGVVRDLTWIAGAASGSGKTDTVTVLKNGSATALTCSMANTSSCSDATHSFTVSAGDYLTMQIVVQSGAATTVHAWAIDFTNLVRDRCNRRANAITGIPAIS